MRSLKLVVLFGVVSLLGCAKQDPQYFEPYQPIIRDLPVYPGQQSRQQFYGNMASFWDRAQLSQPPVTEVLQLVYDLDTVLEAREQQIEAYNRWARQRNARNGFHTQGVPNDR